jgi:predicted enzyme related to lactoylglutathione lyase
MFSGLRTVIYNVSDIDKAKKWYAGVLGIQPYFDQPYYVGFNVGGFELGLDPHIEEVSYGNNVVAYWFVEDIQTAYALMLKQGALKNSDIQDVGDGIRLGTVKDPFGNILGLIENSHFKSE